VTLREWVDSVGGYKAASEILQSPPRTIRSWCENYRRPRMETAKRIIKLVNGALDFNGIYGADAVEKESLH